MIYTADLHIHGRYSQACSKALTLNKLAEWARVKGIDLLGTGDFLHPEWQAEIKKELKDERGTGIYQNKEGFNFLMQVEVSLIYKHLGKGRRIHQVILAPNIETVEQITEYFKKHGRVDYDGRPIFNISSEQLVKELKEINDKIEIIPAHIWTPWFSLFGAKSGYDSFKEAFGNQSHKVHAIETGMSSDPGMNWRIKDLDEKQIISFSDSHSFWPWRLGREATLFDLKELSYEGIIRAIRTAKGLAGTIETEPAYGRYHWDGHRNCGVSMSPEEAKKHNNICPVCKKPLTIGVEHRVEELASRPRNYERKGAPPYWKLIPLHELISVAEGKGINSKTVWKEYNHITKNLGNELKILLKTPKEELRRTIKDKKLIEIIMANREQRLKIKPGYDGEYGRIELDIIDQGKINETEEENKKIKQAQRGLQDYF